jgi:hypothetical protein
MSLSPEADWQRRNTRHRAAVDSAQAKLAQLNEPSRAAFARFLVVSV